MKKLLLLLLTFVLAISTLGLFACDTPDNSGNTDNHQQQEQPNDNGNDDKPNGDNQSQTHTVTFECDFASIPSQTVRHGEKAVKPELTLDGTEIKYYYQNEEWSFIGYVVTQDMTIKVERMTIGFAFELSGATYSITDYTGSATNVYIPSKFDNLPVTSIGGGAFNRCASLQNITIPNSVTSIDSSAFSGCDSLQYNEYDNGLYLGNNENKYLALVKAKDTNITSCETNSNTKIIVDYAFRDCAKLQSITIPNSVTSISSAAFGACASLQSITIPNSVTSIGDSAFYGCTSLQSIIIPNSVTSIGSSAFSGCASLQSITIPNSVTSIGNSAFSGCTSLQSITIPNSVTSIGYSAFSGCTSLQSIIIPNSVTSIGSSAFSGCASLQSITIPNSVTSIGYSAFSGCTSLQSINYNGTKAQWSAIGESSYWDNNTGSYKIYCSDGTLDK